MKKEDLFKWIGFLRKSLKKSLSEIMLFSMFLFLAILFREKPLDPVSLSLESSNNLTQPSQDLSCAKECDEAKKQNSREEKSLEGFPSFLKRRNLFSLEGSYSKFEIPENPYKLIGVKVDPSPEAILKVFTGELIKVKIGQVLLDGSKVIAIKEDRVVLKRNDKTYELKIFDVEVKKWEPKKK